ncbi:LLM class flavin-dependent oxidoreductase [Streptomyces sp. KN37]|uniref:LLM class flavin-dependent oxidoreductase n=1 Tax=Streptomyces sp. KN37 TaxID=3090667 RepID=UPI0039BE44C3
MFVQFPGGQFHLRDPPSSRGARRVGLSHPLLAAKQYATLDHQSGGRLSLGVSAGHVPERSSSRSAPTSRGAGRSSTRRSTRRGPRSSRGPTRSLASGPFLGGPTDPRGPARSRGGD